MMWCMKVRAAAYSALAAYPMDLLETLEALRPLQQCVQLLVGEPDRAAAVEAEVLVGKAIAHEHMRRRRSTFLLLFLSFIQNCASSVCTTFCNQSYLPTC